MKCLSGQGYDLLEYAKFKLSLFVYDDPGKIATETRDIKFSNYVNGEYFFHYLYLKRLH